MTQPDLLAWQPTYPEVAGHKGRETGIASAELIEKSGRASRLRDRVLAAIKVKAMTADECAEQLGESVLSIRPRLSELAGQGKLMDTGVRRDNASGRSAIVWRAV